MLFRSPDVHVDGVILLPRDTIAIERTKFLWQAVCYERIEFRNYADSTRHFRIDIGFGADFRDLFEIRGTSRERRGASTSFVAEHGAWFHYEGLDNVKRKTELRFWPPPSRLATKRAAFDIVLAPRKPGRRQRLLPFSGHASAWSCVMKPIRCLSAIPACPPFWIM